MNFSNLIAFGVSGLTLVPKSETPFASRASGSTTM